MKKIEEQPKNNYLNGVGVLMFFVCVAYYWFSENSKNNHAYEDLKELNVVAVEIRGEFTAIDSLAQRKSESKNLMLDTQSCLKRIVKVPHFRLGEELKWKKISFIGSEQAHHLSFTQLNSGDVVMGTWYVIEDKLINESKNVGLGQGVKSKCLGDILNRFIVVG